MQNEALSQTGLRVPVKLIDPDGRESRGEVWVQNWGSHTRMQLVLMSFAICWGLALLSIFIPIANLVLVPLLIIAAPIVAYFAVREPSEILGGDGACPNCETPVGISRHMLKFPVNESCPKCGKFLSVYPVTERIPEMLVFGKYRQKRAS